MRLFHTITGFIAAVVMLGVSAQADQKIATVNIEKALTDYYKFQEITATLKSEVQVAQTDAGIRAENLKKMAEEHNAMVKELEGVTDEAAKKELAQKIQIKRQAIATLDQQRQAALKESQGKLQAAHQTRLSGLIKILEETVATVAKAKQCDIVLDSSALSVRGNHTVVFNSPAMDLTDAVIKELNKDAPKDYVPASKQKPAEEEKKADPKRSL